MADLKWDDECDVLVVGTGAGAMTAALVAKDGGSDVRVIEKNNCYGGTSAMSGGGVWVPNSHYIEQAGGTDSMEEARSYLKACVGDDVSNERQEAYLTEAPKMMKYLSDNSQAQFRAMPYPDYFPELSGGKKAFRTHEPLPTHADSLKNDFDQLNMPHHQVIVMGRYSIDMIEGRAMLTQAKGSVLTFLKIMVKYWCDIKGRIAGKRDRRITMGGALVARLKASLNDRSVPVILNCALVDLIKEGDNVVGAIVQEGGVRRNIKAAKAVILGAGGFEKNQKMRQKYLPGPTETEWSGGNHSNTGDAILAGQSIGAKCELMDAAWWAPTIPVPDEPVARVLFAERSLPGNVIVSMDGKRFSNEALPYLESGLSMYQAQEKGQKTVPAMMVFDADFRKKYPLGPLMPATVQGDKSLPQNVKDILFKADTIEELAETMGVDKDGLKKTIETNNGFAAKGKDNDYNRGESFYDQYYGDQKHGPNPCIAPIEKPPFYGLAIYPGDIGTKGGLLTNEKAQVLSEGGSVIKGLYAIGNTSASVMGRAYPGAGSTLGPAMTFGYVAARHITGQNE